MDYSLKKDNRKKFQDKQKLKHKHSTPSDKKYYHLKKTEESIEDAKSKQEKLEKKLGNNFERYDKDNNNINSDDQGNNVFEQLDSYDSTEDRIKLQSILRAREHKNMENQVKKIDTNSFTSRDIHSMGINELNNLIGRTNISIESDDTADESLNKTTSQLSPENTHNTNNIKPGANSNPNELTQDTSLIPSDLQDDQAFLDDIL